MEHIKRLRSKASKSNFNRKKTIDFSTADLNNMIQPNLKTDEIGVRNLQMSPTFQSKDEFFILRDRAKAEDLALNSKLVMVSEFPD